MINFLKMKLPLAFSAYAAAMFVFFAFFYAPKLEHFVWANLLLLTAWSTYTWIIVWRQARLIEDMLETMEDTRATINKIINEALDEVEREEAEKKKRARKTRKKVEKVD
jgi:hypothetical protein